MFDVLYEIEVPTRDLIVAHDVWFVLAGRQVAAPPEAFPGPLEPVRLDDDRPRVPLRIGQIADTSSATLHDAPAQHFEDAFRVRGVVCRADAETAQMIAQ